MRAVSSLYTAFETPTLMALGDRPATRSTSSCAGPPAVAAASLCPSGPGGREALAGVHADSRGPHLKMALVTPTLDVPAAAASTA